MMCANKVITGCVVKSFVVCSLFWFLATAKHTVLSKDHNTHNFTKAERENHVIITYLFTKYGSIDLMTFEGYEHLLHRLQLGNIAFDHDLVKHTQHEGSSFKDFHSSHDHRKIYKQRKYKGGKWHVHQDGHAHDDMNEEGHKHNEKSNDGKHTHNDVNSGYHENGEKNDYTHNDKNSSVHTHNKSSDHKHNHEQSGVHTHGKTSEHSHTDKNNGDHASDANTEQSHSDKIRADHNDTKHTNDGDQLAHGEKNQTGYIHQRHKRNLPRVDEDKTVLQKCLTPEQILDLYGYKKESGVTQEQFMQICPSIVAQIENHKCAYTFRNHVDKHDRSHGEPKGRATGAVWGYGCAAVAVISASGLLAVSAISAVHRMSVAGILQFFVSLAVGALTGDALLHLLPHAFESAAHGHDSETPTEDHGIDGVMKGLCGMGIILFFFLFGRIQSIIADTKHRKKLTETNADSSLKFTEVVTVLDERNEKIDTLLQELEENPKSPDPLIEKHHHQSYERSHGHSHGDGDVPSTAGAMVWRVIVGDGIHNFSDGLAIGVSFSDSVTGGLSTAIAVLCHELPHEIGDFAVLLKKGMSIKRAIMYNCLSSVLSLIGVLVGTAVGNIQSVNLYVFVCIAAMFLYISLVDMLPEISINTDKRPVRQLIIQMCGIMFGCTIMLIIALKEKDLKKIVG